MKVLFDTNILIALETPGEILPESLAEMVRLARELKYDIRVHPSQVEDLKRDKDEHRQEVQLSRLRQYPELDDPPVPTKAGLEMLGWSEANDNDRIDNLLLFAVKRSAVSFLVTEDRGIHSKAKRSGLANHVHDADDFLGFLREQSRINRSLSTECIDVDTVPVSHLDRDDSLFDSLRADYDSFDEWLAKCSEDGRKAWIVRDSGATAALCIFKEETDERIGADGDFLAGRSLKLCTFKVVALGKKLGERLLHVALLYAWHNGFRHVYLHTRTDEQPHLVRLLGDFGFENRGRHVTSGQDDVYVKPMVPVGNEVLIVRRDFLDFAVRYYPLVRFERVVHRYLVPIQPQFHDRLFPDTRRQMLLFGESASEANAIRKAYLCRSPTDSLGAGDLLFFYQSRTAKSVECFGIVESARRLSRPDDIIPLVSKRTVYSAEEIRDMAGNGPLLVILFRLVRRFKNPVSMDRLHAAGVGGNIQTVRELPNAAFDTLFKPLLEQTP